MKTIITLLTLFCVSTTPVVQAQSKFSQVYKPGSTLFVSSVAGMSLRTKPSTQGEVLAVVKFGEQVMVLADANPRVSFVSTDVPGTWVKVKAGDKEGYIFDGFLSRYPPMLVSNDFQQYLKEQFTVKSETDKAAETGNLRSPPRTGGGYAPATSKPHGSAIRQRVRV